MTFWITGPHSSHLSHPARALGALLFITVTRSDDHFSILSTTILALRVVRDWKVVFFPDVRSVTL